MISLDDRVINKICDLNKKEKLSCRNIARKLGLSGQTVRKYLRKHNLIPYKEGPKKAKFVSKKIIECSKCNKKLHQENFLLCRPYSAYPYYLTYCNNCRYKQVCRNINVSKDSFLKHMFTITKNRAKHHKITFNLTHEYMLDIFSKQK